MPFIAYVVSGILVRRSALREGGSRTSIISTSGPGRTASQGNRGARAPAPSLQTIGTQIAEVEVDDGTGEVEVLRVVASHDCGTPINPMLVEGQVEGGRSIPT
ncbi:MAG: molybdopterin-dependent oxidoreductase [Acidobacteria bacterium]|nr:molybdopterin-dependent oxidoreductase [Acidobacteriota bacterium]